MECPVLDQVILSLGRALFVLCLGGGVRRGDRVRSPPGVVRALSPLLASRRFLVAVTFCSSGVMLRPLVYVVHRRTRGSNPIRGDVAMGLTDGICQGIQDIIRARGVTTSGPW